MTVRWALAAGVALVAASARANPPFTFRTAINEANSTPLDSVDQVVAQQGGDVAAIVEYGAASSVVFQSGAAAAPLTLIASTGDPIYGVSASPLPDFNHDSSFPAFTNLALSLDAGVEQATFVGHPGVSGDVDSAGVYQYALATGTKSRILSSGDLAPDGGVFSYNAPGSVVDPRNLGLQVNAAGHALFAGTSQSVGTNDVIIKGTASVATTVATGTNTGFNTVLSKKVLTNTDRAVFLSASGAGYQIVDDASLGARVAANADAGFGLITPVQLFAATDSTDLFTASVTGTVDGSFDHALVFHQKGATDTYTPLAKWTSSTDSGRNGSAEMTASNRAAYIVPSASGQTLGYFDGTTGNNYLIATDNDALPGFTIDTLGGSGGLFAPMVNDNGWVVFSATITKPDNPDIAPSALLAWDPVSQQVQIVASFGDALTFQADDPSFSTNIVGIVDPIFDNNRGFDADVLKDGLSDDNHLAFSALLTDANDDLESEAVLVTQLTSVPEPSAILLLPVAGFAMLQRRRRHLRSAR